MSIFNPYNDPIYMNFHKDSEGVPKSIRIKNESQKIYKGAVVLNEIPDEYYKVTISGMNESKEVLNKNNIG